MQKEIELISVFGNFAFAKLPERKFPGIMIQGDTFNNLISILRAVGDIGGDLETELIDTIGELEIEGGTAKPQRSDFQHSAHHLAPPRYLTERPLFLPAR